MIGSQLDILENRVLVLGYGELTEPILEGLNDRVHVVIAIPDEGCAKHLTDHGYDVVTDGPSDEEAFQWTHVDAARLVVIVTNNDTENTLAILTARQFSPDVHIVVVAARRENERKLRRARVNTVINPMAFDGHFLVESAVSRSSLETIEERLFDEQSTEPTGDGTGKADDPRTDDRS